MHREPSQARPPMNPVHLIQIQTILLVSLLLLPGCSFDPLGTPAPEITTTPGRQQIQYCRDVMYIHPELVLEPVGYYYEHGFQDDQIAFKFIARTRQLDGIFDPAFVPPSELVTRKSNIGLERDIGQPWWDSHTQTLIGGNFTVPPPGSQGTRGLNVGIADNGDDTFTVYVYWFET